jgi:hypothetical protein
MPILQEATRAACAIIDDYYKKSIISCIVFVATVIDPRYKLQFFK